MKSILDEGRTWFLDSLAYEDGLTIRLIEGLKGKSPQDINTGDTVIQNAFPIEVTNDSKRATLKFATPVAWQVVDESYCVSDKTEVHDSQGHLLVLSKSKYLDYVNANHGLYKAIAGDACHYRVWTQDEVVDVVSQEPPEIVWDGPTKDKD